MPANSTMKIEMDTARFEEVWRLTTYLVGSLALELQIRGMSVFGLSASEYLVFRIVASANVQRHMRDHRKPGQATQDIVPTPETNRAISRRRVAEASGLPRETVRRIVQRLVERELVAIAENGDLSVPVGLMRGSTYPFGPEDVLGPVARLTDQLLELGVLRVITVPVDRP